MRFVIGVLLIVFGLFAAIRPATLVEPGGPWFRWGPAGRYLAPDGNPAGMVELARVAGICFVIGGIVWLVGAV